SEAGVSGLDVDSWLGIFAPAKTPPDVIAKLRRDIRASLPELKDRFEKSGGEVWDVPDDKLDAFVASEYDNWTKLIREAGIKLDQELLHTLDQFHLAGRSSHLALVDDVSEYVVRRL